MSVKTTGPAVGTWAANDRIEQELRKDNPGRNKRTRSLLIVTALIVIALVTLIPFWAIFIGSFQDGPALMRHGLNLGIDLNEAHVDNYVMLFTDSGNYFRWFFNSVAITSIQVTLTLLISSFVAYGFAMYEFRFKATFTVLVLLLMTVPFEMVMLPLFLQMSDFGLLNNYAGVFLPFIASAMTIFFFRQYLTGIPKDLLEAGRIDGVSEFGIFFRIVLPLMKPAMAAMAILNGMAAWNNMLWPLLVLRSPQMQTLPIGLNSLLTPYGNNYDLLIVGALFSLVPVLILFFVFQKHFISGMTAGAVKG
ncbi:MAG: carbohydrate ABC transporter permease [Promicromonosporaceae bacterium]|nr:carbohydrate ABC transporter permease [Promicromonosporaceae bacterium]